MPFACALFTYAITKHIVFLSVVPDFHTRVPESCCSMCVFHSYSSTVNRFVK